MIFGVDYYPEHWPEDRWQMDAEMMRSAGLEVVRLAEFAWSRLEPQEGVFDWSWLDRAIDVLTAEGLKIILGTPTAAPPAWLSRGYPETLPVGADDRRRDFGSRRHYCPNNPVLRAAARRVVEAMARHYAGDNRIIGWQIDNEFGGGKTARCYCPECASAFRVWLERRYGDLEALNRAWGTVFWSQEYSAWDQIHPANLTVAVPNPSHVLDYYRFASVSIVDFQQIQIDIIRSIVGPGPFITHNFMGLYYDIDQFNLAKGLDLVSWDNYPTANPDRWRQILYPPGISPEANEPCYAYDVGDPIITALAHDVTRGLKRKPFWVMEQQVGQVNWGEYNPGLRPGTVRLWVWHALAHGAEGMVYFRWRSTWFAQEQYHSGMLRHDGTPDLGYREQLALLLERERIDQIGAEPLRPQVAILMDYDDLWALQLQPHRKGFGLLRHLFVYYRALMRLGVQVDIVHPQVDLKGYRLVIAPTLHLADRRLAEHLEGYIKWGGVLLLGVRSGFKTPTNSVTDQTLPGPFRYLSGATIIDWHSLPPGVGYPFESEIDGLEGRAEMWAEAIRPPLDPHEVDPDIAHIYHSLARYTGGPFAGRTALGEHDFGRGRVVQVGFTPTPRQADAILHYLTRSTGVMTVPGLPEGVLAARRGSNLILLNFTETSQMLIVAGRRVEIPSRDLIVISEESPHVDL
jgi:beta-galactosidase